MHQEDLQHAVAISVEKRAGGDLFEHPSGLS
jgi:hypothetical protein